MGSTFTHSIECVFLQLSLLRPL